MIKHPINYLLLSQQMRKLKLRIVNNSLEGTQLVEGVLFSKPGLTPGLSDFGSVYPRSP